MNASGFAALRAPTSAFSLYQLAKATDGTAMVMVP
eukprot:CAMPEP_0204597096 /NCGR_PEP_ID=MMETSP0661-20131031/53619_1 /ASSEMBLY_ACC=CAM_ASM_000606 /TAXON_ID=109239 /ORGANISM="Alexandrium margalefi, Strain AMGDE01CS-322" /LENGTH=34 /DNA_ID= /DNA_START= /DNA_END= /DNA_ORIENTATION=